MKYAIFANGQFWDFWHAETEANACLSAALDVGSEGDTEGMRAFPVTDAEADEVDAWVQSGADAAEIPSCVQH